VQAARTSPKTTNTAIQLINGLFIIPSLKLMVLFAKFKQIDVIIIGPFGAASNPKTPVMTGIYDRHL